MAEERIDIEVTDKGADKAAKSLRRIADEAERGHSYVERLQAALAAINSSPAERLARASASVTNALARETTAAAKLATAEANAAVAQARAATEAQRLATESARTAAAQSRAAVAADAAQRSAVKLAAAQSQASGSVSNLAARAESLKRALDPAYAAQARFNAEILEAKTLYQAGAINIRTYSDAVSQATARLEGATAAGDRHTAGMGRMNNSVGRLRANQANLIAQFNDLGVQFAMAAQSGNPLQTVMMALIQQGSQISYIAGQMDNGWKGVAASAGRLVLAFAPLLIALGAGYVLFKQFHDEVKSANDGALKDYANSLGLTKKEMKELEKASGGFTVTMGDMWTGFFKTVKEGLAEWKPLWDAATGYIGQAWDTVTSFLYKSFIGFYGAVVGGMRAIVKIVANLPSVAKNTAISIANAAITAIEWLVNKAIDSINWLASQAEGITSTFGITFGRLGKATFGRFAQDGKNAFQIIGEEVNTAMGEADRTLTAFGQRWRQNAAEAARDRIGTAAKEIIDDRSDPRAKKGRKPGETPEEKRARALELVNQGLDNELARMKMLNRERTVQERLDSIIESLAQKRIKLTDDEVASIRKRIEAIEAFKPVQAEMDRIYEESVGPAEKMNATVEAATILYDAGKISLEKYTEQLRLATRSFDEATDPLFQMNEALDSQLRLVGLYGRALERQTQLEQIRQEYAARGKSIYDETTGALRAEVAAILAKNDALLQQQYLQSQLSSIVNPMLEDQLFLESKRALYAEIDRLRQQDVLNEEQAQRARLALDARYSEMRLQGAQSFFSELAGLTSSGNAELAAIGKAAAVAQATIDGYVAVQKALASAPPPWNYAMAAAVAVKTGAQVAGIMSTNVGNFKEGGQFIVGGRDGVDANNINMNVTKGERITVETAKQQREAANDRGMAPNVTVPIKLVTVDTPGRALAEMDSDEGEELIFQKLERNPNRLNALVQQTGGNG